MEEFIDALVRWLHLLAAVIFIGPQIFLAFVAMPALRSIEDARARQGAVRAITRGFGVLGGAALAALLVTGIYNYYQFEDLIDADNFPRYFFLIQIKLTLVTIVIALTVLHGAFFGRRLQQLQEQFDSQQPDLDAVVNPAAKQGSKTLLPRQRLDTASLLAVLGLISGGLLALVGALLPWATAPFGLSKAGIEGDGMITLILGLVVAGLAVVRFASPERVWHQIASCGSVGLGVVITIIAIIDIVDIQRVTGESFDLIKVGSGLYLTLIAGVVVIGSGLLGFLASYMSVTSAADESPSHQLELRLTRARQWSMVASMLNLAASVVILLIAALMSSDWSKL